MHTRTHAHTHMTMLRTARGIMGVLPVGVVFQIPGVGFPTPVSAAVQKKEN